jgi:hypothetical protein
MRSYKHGALHTVYGRCRPFEINFYFNKTEERRMAFS